MPADLPAPSGAPPGPDAAGLRLPSIDGLRAFEAAARCGTFERAADELAVTASAVSKRVGTLEDLLGIELFSRSGKTLRLTASGREYLGQVREALGLLAAVPLHRPSRRPVQRLRVSAPPTFARLILVPPLPQFTEEHPEIELELVLSVPYLDLHGSEADVVVRHGPAEPEARLMDDVLLPLAAPALLAAHPRVKSPGDLLALPLLRTPIEPWAPWLEAAGLPRIEPARGPRFVDLGLTLEAALAGQGVALARPTLAWTALQTGTLAPAWPLAVPAATHYHLEHDGTPAAAAFARWLREHCRRHAAAAGTLLQRST
ncbi:MAG: LysR substrate-binding domain-containing protein [Rubrivivax sp.]